MMPRSFLVKNKGRAGSVSPRGHSGSEISGLAGHYEQEMTGSSAFRVVTPGQRGKWIITEKINLERYFLFSIYIFL